MPIVTGGTGLYFSALTDGLAEIPATPAAVRSLADARMAAEGNAALLAELDPATAARIDVMNPARVQRAWPRVVQRRPRPEGIADTDGAGPDESSSRRREPMR